MTILGKPRQEGYSVRSRANTKTSGQKDNFRKQINHEEREKGWWSHCVYCTGSHTAVPYVSTPHSRPAGSMKQTCQTWTQNQTSAHTRRLVILPSTSHRVARLYINKERRPQRHPTAWADMSAMLYTTAQVHRLSECLRNISHYKSNKPRQISRN